MDEEKQIIEAAKELGLGELFPEIYRDMLQPAARHVGDGLATIAKAVKISLAPIEAGIWGYEHIKDWLSVRVTRLLADRKAKNIEPPPMSIAGPLVFQMLFAKEEPELREMYATLLASAMDKADTSPHPAFVTIIQQLCPDEAKLLKYISQFGAKSLELSRESDNEETAKYFVREQFEEFCEGAKLFDRNNVDAYLDNLLRLRLLELATTSITQYIPPGYDGAIPFHEFGVSVTATIQLTNFGFKFLDACVEKTDAPKSV